MRSLSFVLVLLAGCGLLIDTDPPLEEHDGSSERDAGQDGQEPSDAAVPDDGAMVSDASAPDADEYDARLTDIGPPIECVRPAECVMAGDPLGPCEQYTCVEGFCGTKLKDSDTLCNDGDPCTDNDACDAFGMCSGVEKTCIDSTGTCTVGLCDPEDGGRCVSVPTPGAECANRPNVVGTCDESGRCGDISCVPGFADCRNGFEDGCETTLGTLRNCTGCDDACEGPMAAVLYCEPVGMGCTHECPLGFTECPVSGGSRGCVNTSTDILNCGECGNDCGDDLTCVGMRCLGMP